MKIGIFAFGSVGNSLVEFLAQNKKSIDFVGVKKEDRYTDSIIKTCKEYEISSFVIENINDDRTYEMIEKRSPEICFLLWWPDIVKKRVMSIVPEGFVNLHPSLLPFNRGMHPYYWSLVDGTPAGVSIHLIDESIDAGMLLCQKEIETDVTTTGERLYEEAQDEIINLFKENYDKIIKKKIQPKKINIEEGSFHLKRDLDNHSCIDLNKTYKAEDLINIMRARSFPSGSSSFFYLDGQKYRINIKIEKCV